MGEIIQKHLTSTNSKNYINILNKLIDDYNNRYHTSVDYKVDKEYVQKSLKEFYKPIIDIKTKEQDVIKTQNIEH